MSDQLSAAAEAMGVPEPLVERSANAWAEAQGQSVDDVLAAWAGGEAVASAPATDEAPAEQAPAEEPADEAAPTEEPADEPEPAQPAAAAAPAATQPAAAAAEPAVAPATAPPDMRPPILDAPPDRPLVTILGGAAVVVLVVLLGFVFPSIPTETNEVRTSDLPYTAQAQDGRVAYLSAGCASCHTQAIRSVVADVGVGPVTLSDSNQVIGYRRLGPDLADVGSRLSADQLRAVVTGSGHPALPLSGESVDALVAYLAESATSPPDVGQDEESGEDGGDSSDETTEEGGES